MAKKKPSWGSAPQESTTAGANGGWGSAPQESTTGGTNGGWGSAPQESTTGGAGGNSGWGSAPQESTTGGAGGNSGWGSAPQESTTGGAGGNSGWGSAPQESTTGGAPKPKGKPVGKGECPVYSVYVLDGLMFKVRRVVSDQSGEAVIFEVENEGQPFALKLYRRGIVPNHAVLQRIMDLRGNGLLIDIYAHGQWHDDVTGGDYHYEVMQLCEGGSLATVNVNGDEAKLKNYAGQIASAIDFAHKNGVLHRDVKPANFLFVDKKRTRMVLSDWGLAKILDKDGRTVTDAGRTKIYAAPELYTYIPGTPTYIGPKADFFSMGMTLMALWMGEGLLLADETKLVHDKQEETLPYPRRGEMSDHTLGLIKALTRRNPEKRAGFDEIIRWAKGEKIFEDKDDSLIEFRFVFSATDGLIAHNPKELSDMMWNKNRELAKKYLYKDKLKQWFESIESSELAMAMEDITETQFPDNQDAGLYAACLTLDPEMPYPFLTGNKKDPIYTLEELGKRLEDGSFDHTHVESMSNKTFLMWVATRDQVLAGKAMRTPKDRWQIAYSLFPDRGYDFKPIQTSKLATPEQIARQIMNEIGETPADGDFVPDANLVKSLDSNWDWTRLHAYLASKGIYDKQISWIKYCLTILTADNVKKFVPYTKRVGRMKAAAGLLGSVPPITLGGMKFTKPSDVEKADTDRLSTDQQDILADWLSLFYQEDPNADYEKKSYFRRASEYTDMLDNLPECTYALQSVDGRDDMNVSLELHTQSWRKVKTWRWIAVIFGFIPLLIMCAAGIYFSLTMGALDLSESMEKVGYYVGIGAGILIALLLLGDDAGFIIAGICGVLAFVLIKVAFRFLGFLVPWLVIGVMLAVLIIFGIKIFAKNKDYIDDRYTDMDWDEVIDRYYIGIHFDCLDKVFPAGLPADYPMCVIDESSTRAYAELPNVRKSTLYMLGMALAGVALCWFTVKGMRMPDFKTIPEGVALLQGNFSGNIEGTPATIDFTNVDGGGLKATMSIHYQSGLTLQDMVGQEQTAFPVTLPKEGEPAIYLRIDTAYVKDATTVVQGTYCNSKKNLRKVYIEKK